MPTATAPSRAKSANVANPNTAPKRSARAVPVAPVPAPSPVPDALAGRRKAELLKRVSDATRIRIIFILAREERNVTQICEALDSLGQPAVSYHLSLCRHSGLIEARRDGKNSVYHLTDLGRKLAEMVAVLD